MRQCGVIHVRMHIYHWLWLRIITDPRGFLVFLMIVNSSPDGVNLMLGRNGMVYFILEVS
jgi:hypothetical protein